MGRYCKYCSIEVGVHKQLCPNCSLKNKKDRKKEWNKLRKSTRKLRSGFTKSEENDFLKKCASNGIDTISKLTKEYIKLGKNPRSYIWLVARLKELGIYNEPNMVALYEGIRNDEAQKRIDISKGKGFSIVSNNTRLTSKLKCDKCGTICSYTTMKRLGECYKCKLRRKSTKSAEKRDKNKSAKIQKYKSRVDKLKEFVNNEEEYKKYNSYKETPIHKEYIWYNSNNKRKSGITYREEDLTYKLKWIGFYVYINSTASCPDTPIKKQHSICRKCRKEKPSDDFIRNGCKDCAKEYAKEFYIPKQKIRMKERYSVDVVYRLQCIISSYIYGFLKGNPRAQRGGSILGVSVEEFKLHLESYFEDWMNWDNQGKKRGDWQIQHIVPRQFAETEEEAYLLNHYMNLIPMCAYKNNSLHHRVLKGQLNDWHKKNKTIQKILKRNKDRIVDESIFSHIKNHIEVQPPQHNFW